MNRIFSLAVLVLLGLPLVAQDREFQIQADDLLRFDVTSIQVKSGASVTVVLKNTGRLRNHGHNFVLLKPGADVGAFGRSGAQPGEIPADLRDSVIANTPLAAPGETVRVRFTAPAPGRYTYICSYPGHQAKSVGTLIVQ